MILSLTRMVGECKAILRGYSLILLFLEPMVNKLRITTLLATARVFFCQTIYRWSLIFTFIRLIKPIDDL